jgi:hypothetical protein
MAKLKARITLERDKNIASGLIPRNQNDTENDEIKSNVDDSAETVGKVSERSTKML